VGDHELELEIVFVVGVGVDFLVVVDVVDGVLDGVEEVGFEPVAAPCVPEGLMVNAMYPNTPAAPEAQYSAGHPGQVVSHSVIETVSDGA